jgi:hypothetical protein
MEEKENSNQEKKYDLAKLDKFLNKVITKLDSGIEQIGKENENILSGWIKEIKDVKSSDFFITNFDKKLYEENINRPDLELDEQVELHSHLNEFYTNFEKLTDSTTPNQDIQLSNENFINKFSEMKFSIQEQIEIEEFLINQLNTNSQWEVLKLVLMIFSSILKFNVEDKNNFNKQKIISTVNENFTKLIKHHEYRLRTELPKFIKDVISVDNKVINLFFEELTQDIFWNFNLDLEQESITQHKNKNDIVITLDTSKNILFEITQFLSSKSNPNKITNIITQKIIDEYVKFLDNSNKGVRLSSYEILQNFIQLIENNSDDYKELFSYFSSEFKEKVLYKLSQTLVDFYPQVRFSSINFLSKYYWFCLRKLNLNLLTEKFYFVNILPKVCVNRYLPVEGVKNTSLTLWKELVNLNGIKILKENFSGFLETYLQEMGSKSHLGREAGCRCLQEILIKVYEENSTSHNEIISKKSKLILELISNCIKDPCWSVREAALNSAGYIFSNLTKIFVNELEQEERNLLILNFTDLLKLHLHENIYEVRDASAFAIKVLLKNLSDENFNKFEEITKIKELFNLCINYIQDSSMLESAYSEFKNKIYQSIVNNPPSDSTSSQIDMGFMREPDKWEFVDGIIDLIRELSEEDLFISPNSNKCLFKLNDTLQIVIDYYCKSNATLENLSKKSLWKCLTSLFLKLKKQDIEIYFELIGNYLITEIKDHSKSLSGFEAETFLIKLAEAHGKRYIKNRIKNFIQGDKNLQNKLDELLNTIITN